MKKRRDETSHGMFGYTGAFYTYTGKIFDLMVVSVLWVLGCLPIITAGASCSALYAAVSRSVRRDTGTAAAQFWKAYRRDLRASLPIWICYGMAAFIFLLNIGIIRSHADGLTGLFFMMLYGFLTLLLIMAGCYAFPALSRFDMPAGWIIKLSFYLLVRHFPTSLLLLALFAGAYVLILWKITLVIIVPGTVALFASFLIDPILERHMPEGEKKDVQE